MYRKALPKAEIESKVNEVISRAVARANISCGNGLYLRIFGSRIRDIHWYFRGPGRNGEFIRIGDYDDCPYEEAVIRLAQAKSDYMHRMQNPRFSIYAKRFLELKRHLARYISIRKSVEYLKPLFNKEITAISISDAKHCILSQDITPYKMSEVIHALASIMDLAVEDEILEGNKFNILRKSKSFPKHVGKGFKYVEINDFPQIFQKVALLEEPMRSYYVMLPLLCLRPGECRKLRHSWFDLEEKVIHIPGSVMKVKNKEEFRVPLSAQAEKLALYIRKCNPDCDLLFPSIMSNEKPYHRGMMGNAFRWVTDQAVPHGFRKSARSWFAENEVNIEVAAKCLDHTLDTGADMLYQKSDLLEKRRPVMQAWADAVTATLPDSLARLVS